MSFVWEHKKSQYWYARFMDHNGKRRNRSTKVRIKGATPVETRDNKKLALKIADEFEAAARTRRTALQARRAMAELTEEIMGKDMSGKSLSEHVESWLARKQGEVAKSTYIFYKSAVGRFQSFIDAMKLADGDIAFITPEHILQYREHRRNEVAAKTVNHELKCLRMLFKAAKKAHLIADDPTEFVDTIREEKVKVRRGFTIDEVKSVLAVADDEWRSMIFFGLYTGQRLSDISKLTWRNVDLERNEVRLVTEKTGKSLRIPIASPLREHIESLPVTDDPDQPIHARIYDKFMQSRRTSNISNEFANLLYQAGLRAEKVSHNKRKDATEMGGRRRTHELSFHSLRHTAVTLLHDAGVPMQVAQTLIGHDDKAMHELYIGVGQEALNEAANKLPKLT
ncbi:tyrosine-type recombinase/integrase [Rubritalea halochordaticola]